MTTPRRIFVDLDDVLAETTRTLLDLLAERTGRRLELEDVGSFSLEVSFGLERSEWEEFMVAAHQEAVLGRVHPREGAGSVLRRWSESGWRIEVMTGRPPSTESFSRRWLERHGLVHHHLECVDKYGRPDWLGGTRRATPLAEALERPFAAAVEDSLETAGLLAEHWAIPVALLDRPWNRDVSGLSPERARRIVRCRDWEDVADVVDSVG